jgi:hypothetical protein
VIQVKEKQLLKIEIVPYRRTFKPLITAEIHNQAGVLVGKVYRSSSFVYVHPDYAQDIKTKGGEIDRLTLRRLRDSREVFDLKFNGPNEVEVNGVFYVEGLNFPIIATPEYLDINTNRFIRNTIVKSGTGIIVEKDFIAI